MSRFMALFLVCFSGFFFGGGCLFVLFFGKVSHIPRLLLIHYVAEDDHELLSLRPLPSKCRNTVAGSLCAIVPSLFRIRDQTQVFILLGMD